MTSVGLHGTAELIGITSLTVDIINVAQPMINCDIITRIETDSNIEPLAPSPHIENKISSSIQVTIHFRSCQNSKLLWLRSIASFYCVIS